MNKESAVLVKEGQTVVANQLIADRKSERIALSAQLQATNLSIERLQAAPKVLQLPPSGVKTPTFRTSTFTTCIGHEDSTV